MSSHPGEAGLRSKRNFGVFGNRRRDHNRGSGDLDSLAQGLHNDLRDKGLPAERGRVLPPPFWEAKGVGLYV
jgi:hypothetical protein